AQPATLSVKVAFPKGLVTEWYPKATSVSSGPRNAPPGALLDGAIEWKDVSVQPGAALAFPTGDGPSRYYAARATDASPLRVGQQQEKLIFYRGVGSFAPPVRPRYLSDGKLEIRNAGTDDLALAILFENHGGKTGFRVARNVRDSVTMEPAALTGD